MINLAVTRTLVASTAQESRFRKTPVLGGLVQTA